jgi:hypothetical protein
MEKLSDLARLIRSKNAGPFELTIDIMFDSQANYQRVKDSHVISPGLISNLYHVGKDKFEIINFDQAWAIKVTIPRPTVSGNFDDTDVFGGQQYGPLVDLEIP